MNTEIDFADAESGIFGALRPSGASLLFDHEDLLAASTDAAVQLGGGAGETGATLELDDLSLRLDHSPLGTAVSLRGQRIHEERVVVCRVHGELRRGTGTQPISGLGIRRDSVPEAGASQVSLSRSIAVAFADGGLLALRAARPAGASEHGDEEVRAAVAEPEGAVVQVREPLLSTQYDAAGRQVRATLELWPEQGEEPRPPLRAAGAIICGTSIEVDGRRLDVAFFRWSMNGRPGLGRYEILSAKECG